MAVYVFFSPRQQELHTSHLPHRQHLKRFAGFPVLNLTSNLVPVLPKKFRFLPSAHLTGMRFARDLSFRHRMTQSIVVSAYSLALASGLNAYETQLSPSQLHEAWTLGQRNDQATSEFLAPYAKETSSNAANGPHIAEVEILTPFAQVVDRSKEHSGGNYTEQQAAQDYKDHGNTVLVRVRLMLPSAFPKQESGPASAPPPTPQQKQALRPENFWQHFQFNLRQNGKTIAARSVRNKPIYSAPSKNAPSVLDGATVWLEYDAKSVASESATFEIVTPESKTITSTFDLQALR
jgi:hypothetical protein